MNLHKSLGILAIAAGSLQADYINSTVSLGGYVLDAKDVSHDGNFYQSERVNLSALKDGVGFKVAYGYSDFYDKRPNTYQNSNRLALANLNYSPVPDLLKVTAGRDFMPLVERSLYYDGGDVKLQYRGLGQAELFGGYAVPTVYQSGIADFNNDKALIGGKLTLTPLSALVIHLDGLVNGKYDDGSLGGEVQGRLGDRVTLSTHGSFLLDSNYFSHAQVAATVRVRKQDQFQVMAGMEETKLDSTHLYNIYVNKEHQYVFAGYAFSWNENLNAEFDYGMLVYQDTLGQTLDFRVNAYGAYARVGREFSVVPNSLDLRLGYANTFYRYYRMDVSGGYSQYDLDVRKTDLKAFDVTVQPSVLLGHGLEVTGSYEYLHNRLYDNDNRFFFGVKEAFFKGLPK